MELIIIAVIIFLIFSILLYLVVKKRIEVQVGDKMKMYNLTFSVFLTLELIALFFAYNEFVDNPMKLIELWWPIVSFVIVVLAVLSGAQYIAVRNILKIKKYKKQ